MAVRLAVTEGSSWRKRVATGWPTLCGMHKPGFVAAPGIAQNQLWSSGSPPSEQMMITGFLRHMHLVSSTYHHRLILCLVCPFRHPPVSWMGRPRGGKGRKSMEATKAEDGSSGGEEEVIPAYKRRGRPQKHHLKDDHVGDEEDDDDGISKTEEDDDDGADDKMDGAAAAKTTAPAPPPSKAASSSKAAAAAHNPGRKRRRQLKRGSDSTAAGRQGKDEPSSRQNGFRQHGSRRKNSTPRRAAEAGVECK
uniref:Uncharacterized protein n=2 Tax=Oryza brachyantha TaxID=4533 RepID=J3MYQ7_ORYBR